MTASVVVDDAKVAEFAGKVVTDAGGAMAVLLCELGDRLGLLRSLAEEGAATSAELAERTGLQERYVREWLHGLAAAHYLDRDVADPERFSLPPERVPVLADEGGRWFAAPAFRMLPPLVGNLDGVAHAFEAGGGVPTTAYGPAWWDGMQRFTASFHTLLATEWIPSLPALHAKLERGATGADVGCGAGRASISLARAYPASRFVGFDVVPDQIALARANARDAGVGDRVSFEVLEVARGLPGRYDLMTTFDAVHEAIDPVGLLRAIRAATADDGSYLMAELNCADRPEDNVGPLHAMLYGLSVLYCMTTTLAHGGAGLGACGLPEARVRELCTQVGFSSVRRVPLPYTSLASIENILYEVRP
jgi:SAM-dependent methyltransferase